MSLLVAGAELEDGSAGCVRTAGGRITEVGPALAPRRGEDVLDAAGGAVLPGFHDHHVHLRAMAAAARSVTVGPPAVVDAEGLARALREAAVAAGPGGWVRAVGYHESVAGDLDRYVLDRVVPGVPVRVQHRSGALWILSSAALELAGAGTLRAPGAERSPDGVLTGRLWRMDGWLRAALPARDPLEQVGTIARRLAAAGVTGLTDATPDLDGASVGALTGAVASGAIPQRVCVMQPARPVPAGHPRVSIGPVKILLDDPALPALADLAEVVAEAHREGRGVAVHCVTRAQLALALAALADAPALPPGGPRDRIEHAAVVPAALVPEMRRLGVVVVTQPNFVAERGDQYRRDVDEEDRPLLYPCRSLLAAGVPVAAGTDAPFGGADPWALVRAARDRTTASGRVLGPAERVPPGRALELLQGRPDAPHLPRRIAPGQPADLCVLRVPRAVALRAPSAEVVAATVVAGRIVAALG